MEKNILGLLVDTLKENKDTVAEALDSGLEAAQEIPFVGWALKMWNISNTFQEKKFYRNTKAFWDASRIDNPDTLKEKFANIQEANDFIDTLTQVLVDSEKPYKSTMVSNITNALSHGLVSSEEANDMMLVILNASIPALKRLKIFSSSLKGNRFIHTVALEETDRGGTHALLNSMGILHKIADHTALSKLGQDLVIYAYRGLD